MEQQIEYTQNRATEEEIFRHLEEVSELFSPHLAERTDLHAFAQKMVEKANRFEAWQNGKLDGLIAAYVNDPTRNKAFISHLSVAQELRGKGVANTLWTNCELFIEKEGFENIEFEVNVHAAPAIKFHQRNGYEETRRDGDSIFMIKKIISKI